MSLFIKSHKRYAKVVFIGAFRDEIIFVTQITPVLTKVNLSELNAKPVKLPSIVYLEKPKQQDKNNGKRCNEYDFIAKDVHENHFLEPFVRFL